GGRPPRLRRVSLPVVPTAPRQIAGVHDGEGRTAVRVPRAPRGSGGRVPRVRGPDRGGTARRGGAETDRREGGVRAADQSRLRESAGGGAGAPGGAGADAAGRAGPVHVVAGVRVPARRRGGTTEAGRRGPRGRGGGRRRGRLRDVLRVTVEGGNPCRPNF